MSYRINNHCFESKDTGSSFESKVQNQVLSQKVQDQALSQKVQDQALIQKVQDQALSQKVQDQALSQKVQVLKPQLWVKGYRISKTSTLSQQVCRIKNLSFCVLQMKDQEPNLEFNQNRMITDHYCYNPCLLFSLILFISSCPLLKYSEDFYAINYLISIQLAWPLFYSTSGEKCTQSFASTPRNTSNSHSHCL